MTTLHYGSPNDSFGSTPSPPNPSPTAIPRFVYRVHRASAQARYEFGKGFSAKNQTTILNYTSALSRFGLAHLNQQTNISSPFLRVYDNEAHAENVAKHWGKKYCEDTWVVAVDTKHLARGPVFRAADLLKDGNGAGEGAEWLHWGEYLIMYRIPVQAVRYETPVVRVQEDVWKTGVVGEKEKKNVGVSGEKEKKTVGVKAKDDEVSRRNPRYVWPYW